MALLSSKQDDSINYDHRFFPAAHGYTNGYIRVTWMSYVRLS